MSDPRVLHRINLYQFAGQNNYNTLSVNAIDDESFSISTCQKRMVFRDEDLNPNEEGKYIINIEELDLIFFYPTIDLPKEFEMPKEVLESRSQKRKEKEISKNAIAMKEYKGKLLYFYIENEIIIIKMFGYDETGRLKAELPEKAKKISEIETVYNKKALNIEELELGHSHIEAPSQVVEEFEKILLKQRLKNLKFVKVGVNKFNGYEYYKLNTDVSDLSELTWGACKKYFEYFEGDKKFNGWLTCYPDHILKIIK